MKLACSYNPAFYDGRLAPVPKVELMELGFLAYNKIFKNEKNYPDIYKNISLSLHISRSPITENKEYQDIFISEKLTDIKFDDKVISVGFHLCGNRVKNIGKLGFSSHYQYSELKENNAINFIINVQEHIEKEVWIENANFYSSSPIEVIENWKSFSRIISKTSTKSIIDLSHLIIDCSNNNIEPSMIIGYINWDSVTEVHLSGIIKGRDGTLHDGHGNPVSDEVWDLLTRLNYCGLLKDNLYYNIEHSDSTWVNNSHIYQNDFNKVESILKSCTEYTNKKENSLSYAKSYIKKILSEEVSNLKEIAIHFNTSQKELLDSWLKDVLESTWRLSLSRDDMDSLIKKESIYFIDSFKVFIEDKQK